MLDAYIQQIGRGASEFGKQAQHWTGAAKHYQPQVDSRGIQLGKSRREAYALCAVTLRRMKGCIYKRASGGIRPPAVTSHSMLKEPQKED